MKTSIIFSIVLLHFTSSVDTQGLDEDQVALVCPKGLVAQGNSFYIKPINYTQSGSAEGFSICINCLPEKEGLYEWIEICFANNENPLGGPFAFVQQSCENKNSEYHNQFIQDKCQDNKSVCGLSVKTRTSTLELALKSVHSRPCTNGVTNPNVNVAFMPNTAYYDIDLVCPENSTLFGLERFYLPDSGGIIPVLSALCTMKDNIKNSMIFIYAKGKLNDTKILDLLYSPPDCPFNSVNGKDTRCILLESPSKFCSLRWHSTYGTPEFDFVTCSKINTQQPIAQVSTTLAQVTETPAQISIQSTQTSSPPLQVSKPPTEVSTTPAQVSTPPSHAMQPHLNAKESHQNIYIIFGIFFVLFILLIIVLTLYIIKIKNFRREDDFKRNDITENATPNQGNNTVRDEQLEDLCYEEVEDKQIAHGSKFLQKGNHNISVQNLETIALQANDKYLYTVPDNEENSLNQTPESTNYVNAEMFIK